MSHLHLHVNLGPNVQYAWPVSHGTNMHEPLDSNKPPVGLFKLFGSCKTYKDWKEEEENLSE